MSENIFGLTIEQLKEKLKPLGMQPFRAGQIIEWMYQKNVYDFEKMTNLSLDMRTQLQEYFIIDSGEIAVQKDSEDKKTSKMLVEFADGSAVETVLMRQSYGNSICISSQAGCSMGCSFCASTLHGLKRNLTAGEMLAQAMKSQVLSHAVVL